MYYTRQYKCLNNDCFEIYFLKSLQFEILLVLKNKSYIYDVIKCFNHVINISLKLVSF